MAASPPARLQNRLLTMLPAESLAAIMPLLSAMAMPLRRPIYRPGTPIEAVFFPEAGMISLVADMEDGMRVEVGIVGREGMLGTALLAGIDLPFSEAMVQLPGSAWRMAAGDFRRTIDADAAFRSVLLRYNEYLQAQIMQTAACNGRHSLQQRMARWLLMAHDRCRVDDLPLTQDFMSMMLGVHRPSLTVTARSLQTAGLIEYSAGQVMIRDRAGLEAMSCECYSSVRRRRHLLLGGDNG